jgi:hypothetical protein
VIIPPTAISSPAMLVEDAVLTYMPAANIDILSDALKVIPISGRIASVINAVADVL